MSRSKIVILSVVLLVCGGLLLHAQDRIQAPTDKQSPTAPETTAPPNTATSAPNRTPASTPPPLTPVSPTDSASLGDIARQLHSQKSKAQSPAPVINNENLDAVSDGAIAGLAKGGRAARTSSDREWLIFLSIMADRIDLLDRTTVVRLALQDSDVAFPERIAWEKRLIAAKQAYVAECRIVATKVSKMNDYAMELDAEGVGPDNVRAEKFLADYKNIMLAGRRADTQFQMVIKEGRTHVPPSTSDGRPHQDCSKVDGAPDLLFCQ
jgi:hypothetical protein